MTRLLTTLFFSILLKTLACQVIYVNSTAAGGNNGTSWEDAYTSLQGALAASQAGDSLWVATGTYFPTADSDRTAYFELKNGVKLFGGFDGTEAGIEGRDWEANATVLSGDIGTPGDSTDNSYTILYMTGVDTTALVDGFFFTGGGASGSGGINVPATCGGAIYINGAASVAYPEVRNCRFEKNVARYGGGAVYVNGNNGGDVAPQFTNCAFVGNRSEGNGGAVQKDGGAQWPTSDGFSGCLFEANEAGQSGGGIFFFDGDTYDTITIEGCTFKENRAGNIGGGICYLGGNENGAKILVRNTFFTGNLGGDGGTIFVQPINVLIDFVFIENCEFSVGENSDQSPINISGMSNNGAQTQYTFSGCLFKPDAIDSINNRLMFVESNRDVLFEGCIFSNFRTAVLIHNVSLTNLEKVSYHVSSCLFNSIQKIPLFDYAILFRNIKIDSFFIENSIFYDNDAYLSAFIQNNPYPVNYYTTNSVFVNNKTFAGGQESPQAIHTIRNSILLGDSLANILPLDAAYTDIESCLVGAVNCDSFPYFTTCDTGTIFNLDPMFVDTASGDFRLLPCSPARNAGNNNAVDQIGLLTDIAGSPRIQEGTVDMGAYEMTAYSASVDSTASVPCTGTGTATIGVQSGCPPFSVSFAGASFFTDSLPIVLDGLPAGTYAVTVKDSEGRVDSLQVEISAPPILEATAVPVPVDCGQSLPGSAVAVASGGAPGYAYLWDNGTTGSGTDGLAAGPHSLTVTDTLGCTAVDTFLVSTEGQMGISAGGTPPCHGAPDGSAWASPDGLPPFGWAWQGGQSDSLLTMLPAGTYAVTVTDALGCTAVGSTELQENTPVQLDTLIVPATGAGIPDGSIAVSGLSGGTPPYSLLWQTGDTTAQLGNLLPGAYSLTVTDSLGCETGFVFEVDIETGTEEAGPGLSVRLEPNPTGRGQSAKLVRTGGRPGPMTVAVYDVLGRQVSSLDWPAGQSVLALPPPGAPGLYWVVATDRSGRQAVLNWTVE